MAATKSYSFEGFNIDPLIKEFVNKREFSYETISSVFGPAPKIPDSPDTDARLEAWEAQAEYCTRIQRMEDEVQRIIAKTERGD